MFPTGFNFNLLNMIIIYEIRYVPIAIILFSSKNTVVNNPQHIKYKKIGPGKYERGITVDGKSDYNLMPFRININKLENILINITNVLFKQTSYWLTFI